MHETVNTMSLMNCALRSDILVDRSGDHDYGTKDNVSDCEHEKTSFGVVDVYDVTRWTENGKKKVLPEQNNFYANS